MRNRLLMLLMMVAVALPASAAAGTSKERRDANRFILEKLNRENGEGWQRAGQFFLWSYRFSSDGCTFDIKREAVEGGGIVAQKLPLADIVPVWQGSGSLALYCQSTTDCIEMTTSGAQQPVETKALGQTTLLAPVPDDLPKLNDAFVELHRLCDDAYRSER